MRCTIRGCLDVLGRSVIILFDIYYMLGGSFLQNIFPYRKWLACFAFAIFIFMILLEQNYEKHNKREIQWTVIMLMVSILCAFVTGEVTLVISSLCILSCIKVDKIKLFYCLLIEKIFFLTSSIVLSIAGIIQTESGIYKRLYSFIGNNEVYRRSLGFTNYNRLGITVLEIMIIYILYIRQKQNGNLKNRQYAFLIGLMLVTYAVSGSRTAFISEVVLLIIMKLCDVGWIKLKVLKAMIMGVMVGASIFFSAGIVLLHDLNINLYHKLDDILQARIVFIYRYMLKFGIKLFGNNTSDLTGFWGGGEARFDWISLDCGYAVMVIEYGVLVTVLIILMHALYLYGKQHSVNPYVLCVMLAISIYNISERALVLPTVNFSLLYLSDMIKRRKRAFISSPFSQEDI